jgi:hypothetical protein
MAAEYAMWVNLLLNRQQTAIPITEETNLPVWLCPVIFVQVGSRVRHKPPEFVAISADLVDGIQWLYDGGWDPSGESDGSKSEQVKQCMDLEQCLHWLH